jgi:phosphate transport system protein
MRAKFDRQLDLLNSEIIEMGDMCVNAISSVVMGLFETDVAVGEKLADFENQINHKEREIEGLCMRLLLQQQPVARDLRTISSALKMISDMERIGDQAFDISEILGVIGNERIKGAEHISEMAKAAIKMVTDSVQSFVNKDIELVKKVISYDDVVDELFVNVKKELIKTITENPEKGEICLDFLMIAKYFERIGDHATNIAQWVEYSITGKHMDNMGNVEE